MSATRNDMKLMMTLLRSKKVLHQLWRSSGIILSVDQNKFVRHFQQIPPQIETNDVAICLSHHGTCFYVVRISHHSRKVKTSGKYNEFFRQDGFEPTDRDTPILVPAKNGWRDKKYFDRLVVRYRLPVEYNRPTERVSERDVRFLFLDNSIQISGKIREKPGTFWFLFPTESGKIEANDLEFFREHFH